MSQTVIALGDIALKKGGSVDPKKHQEEVFELYSIPAYDAGSPEVLKGAEIGSSKKVVKTNDVMISRIVPHIRRACVVGKDIGHRQIASGEWIVFRDETIWPRYLRWVLMGDVFHSAFMRTVSGVGGSLLRARPKEVYKIEIPLPPLAEQKRIAGILDAADKLRAKRRESIAQLDILLQSTFLDMFGDPVTNSMGWETRKFGELVANSFRNGLSPSTKGLVDGEVLTLSAITRGRFDGSAKKVAKFDRAPSLGQQLSKDTFLICRGNGNRNLVGSGAFPDRSNKEVSFPDTMIGATIDSDLLSPAYLESVWQSRLVRRQISSGARTTNGTYKVNQKLLTSIVIPCPPIKAQLRFEGFMQKFKRYKNILSSHEFELDTLFAALQQRAFNGTL